MGERAEGAVGRGVAVAADDGHARQGEALLGPDDVDDALAVVELMVIFDAEFARVLGERLDLERRFRIVDALGAVGGRHVVVDHGQRPLGARTLRPAMRSPSKACGLVTSWTRCRSI